MKRYLLDTCCISEFVRKEPNPKVVRWFEEEEELNMYLSILTIGELRKGIEKMPLSKRKKELDSWLSDNLMPRFENRLVDLSTPEIETWGKITAQAEKSGTPLPVIDGLIAATALTNNLSLVTRNTKDFDNTPVELVNPWK